MTRQGTTGCQTNSRRPHRTALWLTWTPRWFESAPARPLTGTVVQVTDDEVCVNIGYKADGLIKREDLSLLSRM